MIARCYEATDDVQGEVSAQSGVVLRLISPKLDKVPEVRRMRITQAGEAATSARVEKVLMARNIEEAFSNRTVIARDAPECANS